MKSGHLGGLFPGGSDYKESAIRRPGFNPWVGKFPVEQLPTLVFLPGKSHTQRNLEGYGPWGHKESDKNGTK